MAYDATDPVTTETRPIVRRTSGHVHGPVTRLFSPGDLGQVLKPFVFLDRIDMDAGAGALFGYHPHSGIATITTVFQGDTAYEDSTGASGILKAGGVEWMKAGGGAWHTANPAEPGRVKGYQLWLALPEALENSPAESVYLTPEDVAAEGPVQVILGRYKTLVSALPQMSPLTYLSVTLRKGEIWRFDPADDHDLAWVAVDDGQLAVSGSVLSGEAAVFADGSQPIDFEALSDVSFMLGSAARHPHPLVMGHYSVHTTREALRIGEAGIRSVGERLKVEGKL